MTTDAFESLAEGYGHPYTPKVYGEMHNTLSCHQMGGLVAKGDVTIRPVKMGEFQAQRLLEAGYVLVYSPERASRILADAAERGDL